jgi:two-component system invasion response regulator UvrY
MSNIALTDKELLFLKLCVEDISMAEIAAKMYVSPRTADGYAEKLRIKLNVNGRVGFIRFAIANGIAAIKVYECPRYELV